uniref:Uncharacterized protein n=1 Tax=Inoviridae sp. ctPjN3 TaxID=2826761 RepID=A0A8S5NHL3_9VIRU|nr:MAG TPA: hypothetical protein [Inoviridae sp. ctPjN3]
MKDKGECPSISPCLLRAGSTGGAGERPRDACAPACPAKCEGSGI